MYHRVALAYKWRVEFFHYLECTIRAGTNHDAIRFHEVFDGYAFAEELRVGNDIEGDVGVGTNFRINFFGWTHGYGAFVNDDSIVLEQRPKIFCNPEYILEIGRAVLAGRSR